MQYSYRVQTIVFIYLSTSKNQASQTHSKSLVFALVHICKSSTSNENNLFAELG